MEGLNTRLVVADVRNYNCHTPQTLLKKGAKQPGARDFLLSSGAETPDRRCRHGYIATGETTGSGAEVGVWTRTRTQDEISAQAPRRKTLTQAFEIYIFIFIINVYILFIFINI